MDSWGMLFLGFIALGSLVQAFVLIGMALGGFRLVRRVQQMQGRAERELQPAVDSLSRVARNAAEVSELATVQARRLEELVTGARERVEDAREHVGQALRRPLGSLADLAALVKGLRRGLRVYRQLGGVEAKAQGATRRYRDDEHLFI